MTIKAEDLRQFPRRDKLASIARHIEFLNTCINAVPGFRENTETIESYLSEMEKACADMEKELTSEQP
jgi:hypothetical protein